MDIGYRVVIWTQKLTLNKIHLVLSVFFSSSSDERRNTNKKLKLDTKIDTL